MCIQHCDNLVDGTLVADVVLEAAHAYLSRTHLHRLHVCRLVRVLVESNKFPVARADAVLEAVEKSLWGESGLARIAAMRALGALSGLRGHLPPHMAPALAAILVRLVRCAGGQMSASGSPHLVPALQAAIRLSPSVAGQVVLPSLLRDLDEGPSLLVPRQPSGALSAALAIAFPHAHLDPAAARAWHAALARVLTADVDPLTGLGAAHIAHVVDAMDALSSSFLSLREAHANTLLGECVRWLGLPAAKANSTCIARVSHIAARAWHRTTVRRGADPGAAVAALCTRAQVLGVAAKDVAERESWYAVVASGLEVMFAMPRQDGSALAELGMILGQETCWLASQSGPRIAFALSALGPSAPHREKRRRPATEHNMETARAVALTPVFRINAQDRPRFDGFALQLGKATRPAHVLFLARLSAESLAAAPGPPHLATVGERVLLRLCRTHPALCGALPVIHEAFAVLVQRSSRVGALPLAKAINACAPADGQAVLARLRQRCGVD